MREDIVSIRADKNRLALVEFDQSDQRQTVIKMATALLQVKCLYFIFTGCSHGEKVVHTVFTTTIYFMHDQLHPLHSINSVNELLNVCFSHCQNKMRAWIVPKKQTTIIPDDFQFSFECLQHTQIAVCLLSVTQFKQYFLFSVCQTQYLGTSC